MGNKPNLTGFRNLSGLKFQKMTTITIKTIYQAPIETVFNINRDITIHQQTASKTKEIAIAGTT